MAVRLADANRNNRSIRHRRRLPTALIVGGVLVITLIVIATFGAMDRTLSL